MDKGQTPLHSIVNTFVTLPTKTGKIDQNESCCKLQSPRSKMSPRVWHLAWYVAYTYTSSTRTCWLEFRRPFIRSRTTAKRAEISMGNPPSCSSIPHGRVDRKSTRYQLSTRARLQYYPPPILSVKFTQSTHSIHSFNRGKSGIVETRYPSRIYLSSCSRVFEVDKSQLEKIGGRVGCLGYDPLRAERRVFYWKASPRLAETAVRQWVEMIHSACNFSRSIVRDI